MHRQRKKQKPARSSNLPPRKCLESLPTTYPYFPPSMSACGSCSCCNEEDPEACCQPAEDNILIKDQQTQTQKGLKKTESEECPMCIAQRNLDSIPCQDCRTKTSQDLQPGLNKPCPKQCKNTSKATCPACQEDGKKANICPLCLEESDAENLCPICQEENEKENVCPKCRKQEEDIANQCPKCRNRGTEKPNLCPKCQEEEENEICPIYQPENDRDIVCPKCRKEDNQKHKCPKCQIGANKTAKCPKCEEDLKELSRSQEANDKTNGYPCPSSKKDTIKKDVRCPSCAMPLTLTCEDNHKVSISQDRRTSQAKDVPQSVADPDKDNNNIEETTVSCDRLSCVAAREGKIPKDPKCCCVFPPAYKQYECMGLITGDCKCPKKE